MPRLSEVPRSEVHSFGEVMYGLIFGDRDPVEEPGTASGTPGDWWTVTALSPDAFDHICNGLIYYRSPNRKLDPRLRELGQIRAGWGSGSRFVFSQHCKAMRDNGSFRVENRWGRDQARLLSGLRDAVIEREAARLDHEAGMQQRFAHRALGDPRIPVELGIHGEPRARLRIERQDWLGEALAFQPVRSLDDAFVADLRQHNPPGSAARALEQLFKNIHAQKRRVWFVGL